MHVFRKSIALALAAATISFGAFAQHPDDHHDDHGGPGGPPHGGYVQHREWRKGYHMNQGDWGRGEQVDWRSHHLHQPPHGYEWRQVDGNYVMAAVATGVIASVIVASAAH